MAIYHGVEWHHDMLTVLAMCYQHEMAYAGDAPRLSFNDQRPETATHYVPVHTACLLQKVLPDKMAAENWVKKGIAFERPNLPLSIDVTTECWLCRHRSHDD